jgi:hypothetical protein
VKIWFVVLVLLVASGAARAENWVVLRKPAEIGESAPAGISVDSNSIEILESGIRRARVKVDFLGHRLGFEKLDPNAFSFTIWINSYDCDKKMSRNDSMETHWVDGSVHTLDLSNSRWYQKAENPALDPSFDFVCGWKAKKVGVSGLVCLAAPGQRPDVEGDLTLFPIADDQYRQNGIARNDGYNQRNAVGRREHNVRRYDRSFEELFVVGARRDGGSTSRWRGLLESVDVRQCDRFRRSAADGQREGAAVVGIVYGRRLDKLGNASSG